MQLHLIVLIYILVSGKLVTFYQATRQADEVLE